MTCTQKPISIPEPTNDVDSLWKTTQSLKEAVEVFQGLRGDREYALLCDLEDTTTIVNNILGGGTPGITSFYDLLDTDLTTQTQYDLAFNADGTEWHDTAGLLKWNPSVGMILGNDLPLHWEDTGGTSQ